jgi:hypothetical protein
MRKDSNEKSKEWLWLQKQTVWWSVVAIGRGYGFWVRRKAQRQHLDIIEHRVRRLGRK